MMQLSREQLGEKGYVSQSETNINKTHIPIGSTYARYIYLDFG